MLWFLSHNIITNFTFMEVQTRNLYVFLIGTVIYTLLYSWLGTFSREQNPFLNGMFNFFLYIILADGFAMAVLYKNYFGRPIHSEVKETLGASPPTVLATNVEPITHIETDDISVNDIPTNDIPVAVPQLSNSVTNAPDNMEGFMKDTALGDSYSTNGNSNTI